MTSSWEFFGIEHFKSYTAMISERKDGMSFYCFIEHRCVGCEKVLTYITKITRVFNGGREQEFRCRKERLAPKEYSFEEFQNDVKSNGMIAILDMVEGAVDDLFNYKILESMVPEIHAIRRSVGKP